MASPLTALLKREAFSWSEDADRAFLDLKRALATAPLLQLPDFSKQFIIDCVMLRAAALVPFCIKVMVLWLSLVGQWPLSMPNCPLTSENSLAWSKPSSTGGHMCGVGRLLFGPTIGVSNSYWTSASLLSRSILR